jgi:hypothetical protein
MIELIKTVVDTNRKLVGFVATGRKKDFGGIGNDKIESNISIAQLVKSRFRNSQIQVAQNGAIIEKGRFLLNSLPIAVYVNGKLIDISNSIEITKRYVQNNENIGFETKFADGTVENYRYENLVRVCKIFKPSNFVIRRTEKGKFYIAGKNGTLLEDIPAIEIGQKSNAKRVKSGAKEMTGTVERAENGVDLIDIYDFLDRVKGLVVKLPDEDYKATVSSSNTAEGFIPLGIGEIASSTPQYNDKKLNINARFKKVGVVPVEIMGDTVKVPAYVHRTKSIFSGGENHIKKLGVAVPVSAEGELVNIVGKSLALEKLTDKMVIEPLSQMINSSNYVFYKIDTNKLDLMSKDKINSSLLSAENIADLLKKQFHYRVADKTLGSLSKNLKTILTDDEIKETTGTDIYSVYKLYSKEGLEAIKEAGIDIYTGAFTAVSQSSGGSKGDEEKEDILNIEYVLKGYDPNKITSKKALEDANEGSSKIMTKKTLELIANTLNIPDEVERFKVATEKSKEAYKEVEAINKKLWMHNVAMYLNGGKVTIHNHDSNKWEIDTTTRVKTATVYTSTVVPGLSVKVNGVTINK